MSNKKYLIFFVIISFILFLRVNLPNPIKVQGDGIFYYGWATSIIFDHDIDLTNQLQKTYNYDFYSRYFIDNNIKTQTNITPNPYAFGSAIFWLPSIIFINIIHDIGQLFDIELFVKDGYSDIYIFILNFITWFCGIVAVAFVYKLLRYYFSSIVSLISIIAIWLATPFIYYHIFEPSMSHTISIMMSSVFVWYMIKSIHTQKINYIINGIIIFLMIAVRWQNILFVAATLPVYIHFFTKQINIRVFFSIFFATSTFAIIQMYIWKSIYNVFVIIPQGDKFIGKSFYFFETLFSTNRGLMVWSPVIIISFFGVYFLYKKQKYITIMCLLAFVGQWIINSILSDPGGGDAFGGRRFIGVLPFIALMLGAVVEKIKYKKIMLTIVLVFVIWNIILIQNYRKDNIPHSGNFDILEIKYLNIFL